MNKSRSTACGGYQLLLLVVCLLPTGTSAQLYQPEHLVVQMFDGYSIQIIHSRFGTSTAQYLANLDIYLVNAGGSQDLEDLADSIRSHSGVRSCHPNYMTDPMQAVQGSLPASDDLESHVYTNQTLLTQLDVAAAHGISTGQGVKVAVIDGGVSFDHPALEGQAVSVFDYIDGDSNAYDEPGGVNSGHGTFVAGLVHLIAPDAQIYSYRVTDTAGLGNGYVVAEAMIQAADDGCQVINLSQVMTGWHSAMSQAMGYCQRAGCLTIVAAGNGGSRPQLYPASDRGALTVAAVDSTGRKADFSCYGWHIDICAPGVEMVSSYSDSAYALWSGTSFAAPVVAGQAALIRSAHPYYSAHQIGTAIKGSADDIDALNPGYAGLLGFGLVDPMASLTFDPVMCGDVDGNGYCDLSDIVALVSYVCGIDDIPVQPSVTFLAAADVDSDPGVTSNDVAYLLEYYLQLGTPPCQSQEAPIYELGGSVSVSAVSGLVGCCSLAVNQPITFTIRVKNDIGEPVRYLSNGFSLSSPDGAVWSERTLEHEGYVYELLRGQSFFGHIQSFAQAHGLSPMGETVSGDNIVGSCSWSLYPLDSSLDGEFFKLMIGSFGSEDVGKTLVLDSSAFGGAGTWEWTFNGTNRFAPRWGGPYVFTIVDPGYVPGDINGDSKVDVADVVFLVEYMFFDGPAPENQQSCDVDGSCGEVNVADLVFLVDYFFNQGQLPLYGCSEMANP